MQIFQPGTIINNYQVVNLLGAGGYAGIYKVRNTKNNQLYAMKTESIDAEIKTLSTEIEIMKQLKEDFFPKLRDSGTNDKYHINFLVMDIYGTSIDTIQAYNRKKLDMSTVYNVCYQMFLIIEKFHEYGFVHRDIKPSNFLIQNNKNSPLILIDFGISKKHIDPTTNKPYQFKKESLFAGTTRYASISSCGGSSYGRRDDLISWFYSFLDLVCGYLPWDEATNFADMIFMKNFLNLSCLDHKFPKEISDLYKYLKKLKYSKEPDYNYVKQLFLQSMKEEKISFDQFNWVSFYSKYSNLEVFTRELSLGQLRRSEQKNKGGKNENKPLKKTKSAPAKIKNVDLNDKKSNSHFILPSLFTSKSDSKKKSNNKGLGILSIIKKNTSGDKKDSVDVPAKNQDKSDKIKTRKKPPAIPNEKASVH